MLLNCHKTINVVDGQKEQIKCESWQYRERSIEIGHKFPYDRPCGHQSVMNCITYERFGGQVRLVAVCNSDEELAEPKTPLQE